MAEVDYQIRNGVAIATLTAPQRRNSLALALVRELASALALAEADERIGAFVLAAEGPAFCAGGDRTSLDANGRDPVDGELFDATTETYELFGRLQRAKLPTLAAVGGAVVGAGVNLALSCDLRIAGDDLRVLGFAMAGLHPGGGHLALLRERLGESAAAALGLFGEALDAEGAVELGFAWTMVPRAELEARALSIAERLAADPENARAVTRSWRAVQDSKLSPEAAFMLERAAQMRSMRRRVDAQAVAHKDGGARAGRPAGRG